MIFDMQKVNVNHIEGIYVAIQVVLCGMDFAIEYIEISCDILYTV